MRGRHEQSDRGIIPFMTDLIIQRVETFRCPRGQLVAERRNRGYTLYHAQSGRPIARLRPDLGKTIVSRCFTGRSGKKAGPAADRSGRATLSVERALEFIAAEDIFWTAT